MSLDGFHHPIANICNLSDKRLIFRTISTQKKTTLKPRAVIFQSLLSIIVRIIHFDDNAIQEFVRNTPHITLIIDK